MTASELIEKFRDLCHEATARGEASEIITTGLEVAQRLEEYTATALIMNEVIHDMTKDLETAMERVKG